MKITYDQGFQRARHKDHLRLESAIPKKYFVDRKLKNILLMLGLKFDWYAFFEETYQKRKSPIEFLDSGCGEGYALVDFRHYLGDKARLTGITLNPKHVQAIQALPEKLQPDEVIVGPLEYHLFDRQFDFILDYLGPAHYFPAIAIKKYGQILNNTGIAITKLPLYDHNIADRVGNTTNKVTGAEQLLRKSGLEVIEFRADNLEMSVLLKKAT